MANISMLTLLAYAAPKLPLAALYFPVLVYLAPFYIDVRGFDAEAVALAFVGARLLDAISDPLMGALSDRLRTRWGRRKIWLAIATPLTCVSVWMVMVPPEGAGEWYLAFWLCALTLSWTIALTPYDAWGGELSSNYAERAKITVWREGAFLLGALGSAGLYTISGGGEAGLRAIAIFVAVALPLAAAFALWRTPEGPDSSSRRPLNWRAGALAIMQNAPFKRLLLAYLVNGAANALPAALFLLYATRVLGADDMLAGAFSAVYFLAAVLAAPLWSFAAKRWSKHRAWCVAMLYACVIFAFAPLLGRGDFAAYLIICVLTGAALGADIALPSAMQADVVDVDTAATGQQRTGLYFAFWSVATKASSGLAGGAALWILGRAGFESASEQSAPEAMTALVLLYAAAPIALKLIAVALMWRFPLDAAAQAQLRRKIDDRSAQAAPAVGAF